jgi:putative transposase
MDKNNVIELERRVIGSDPLTELLKEGARKLLARAVESEVQDLLASFTHRRTPCGHAGVVRNGYQPERALQTGLGPIRAKIPKVRSKTGETVSFQSVLVPPYIRKTPSLEAAVPWLYLKGISSGEMEAALQVLVGPQAKGLSASTVSRLKQVWADEYQHWNDTRQSFRGRQSLAALFSALKAVTGWF